MLTLVLYLFIAVVIIQLSYYLGVFRKFAFAKTPPSTQKTNPISVIVRVKNEAENVARFVPLLAEQHYPDFEVVIIDDASSDTTLDVLEDLEKKYPNIRLVKVQNNEAFWANKKYALTLGIKAAKKECLLFIDSDCYPSSKNWITAMASAFSTEKSIVLGYSKFEKIPKSLLNKIIRFENLMNAVLYFSWAKMGFPFMGTGKNLGYTKELFFNVNGFIEHIKIRIGDDELFVNQAATGKNTAITFVPESFTTSAPKTTFSDFFNQKRIQADTANYFKLRDKIQLSLFYASQFIFILTAVILLSFQFEWILVISLFLVRYIMVWTVIGYSSNKLDEKDLKLWYPILEIVYIFTQIQIYFYNLISKPAHWK